MKEISEKCLKKFQEKNLKYIWKNAQKYPKNVQKLLVKYMKHTSKKYPKNVQKLVKMWKISYNVQKLLVKCETCKWKYPKMICKMCEKMSENISKDVQYS